MNNEHAEMFKEEAYELLEELETSLMELEKTPDDADLVGTIFRALHTIKGSGAMFGFDDISEFAHQVENVFQLVREDKVEVSKELVDRSLSACDVIKRMLDMGEERSSEEIQSQQREIVTALQFFAAPPPIKEGTAEIELSEEEPEEDKTYRIRLKPPPDVFQKGIDMRGILEEVCSLGICRIVAHVNQVPVLEKMEAEACYIYWDIILTTDKGINAIKDVLIFLEDDAEIAIDVIDDSQITDTDEVDYMKLGDILVEREDLSVEDMQRIVTDRKYFGELLVEEGLVKQDDVESALVEQEHVRELRKKRVKDEVVSTLRVPADKADKLVNLVGELVTLQARLTQISEDSGNSDLVSVVEETERLVWDLRDNTMSIRMVPISTSFARFRRMVRDLSNELSKETEFITAGGDTELDKTVIERLNDPLIHIMRNCLDHGIESPEERVRIGKPANGAIWLTASYSGANVLITIKDDGSGIDPEKIKERAIERGLVKPDADLSDRDIFSYLFEPGFSTAARVTSVSGRGVGMDVVKRNIDALRGAVHVKSQIGKGTEINIKIPLTLAIIDGLLVRIRDEYFILPLSMVEEIVELTEQEIERTHGRHITKIRGKIVPYVILRDRFVIPGAPPSIQQIVVVEVEHRRIGFVVDKVIGKHQTVIKSLGKVYRNVDGLSGATILGDGTVALILDVSRLAQGAAVEADESYD
jgi:two-component system chemotaxis sensor kinase CheA